MSATDALPLNLLAGGPAAQREAIAAAVLQPEAFRFLDAVVGQGPTWIQTRWEVPDRPELFRGDDRARILPGTLITEHVVQSGELLIYALRGPTTADEGVPVLTRIRQARFRRMVRPGEVLETRIELEDQLGPVYKLGATVRCDGGRVVDLGLDFAATLALKEAAPG